MNKRFWACFKNHAIVWGLLAAATVLGSWFRAMQIHEANLVMLYLLAVLLTARFTTGYAYGIYATLWAFLLYNWFFTEPFYSLKINDPTNIVTVLIMTVTATITSALTAKVKQAAVEAREKEAESNALYRMTNHLTDAENAEQIASIVTQTVSGILGCLAGVALFDETGRPQPGFLQQREDGSQIHRRIDNPVEFRRRMERLSTAWETEGEFCDCPVYGRSKLLAVVRIPRDCAEELTEPQLRLLHALIENASLALDRLHSLEQQARSRDEAAQERYRGNLLRAISHDLRTPLSGIMGTGEMLMGMTEPEDPRYQMARDIYEDADWLHGLVENILSLTRVQEGRLTLHKEPEAAEEIVGAALSVMEKRCPGREIGVQTPPQLLLVPMDARLVTQVLVNLLDNALRHTPAGREVRVELGQEGEQAVFSVLDRGCGIPPEAMPRLFQMFYTTAKNETSGKRGIGLGLSICQSVVEAHGGTIEARNRPEGGAEFRFTLPMKVCRTDAPEGVS